jgi:hypothetical protein
MLLFTAGATLGAFMTRYGILWPMLTAFTLFAAALPILLQAPGEPRPAARPQPAL